MRDITEAAGDGIRAIAHANPVQVLHSLALYGIIVGLTGLLYLEGHYDNLRERQLITTLVNERAHSLEQASETTQQTQALVTQFVEHLSRQAPTKADEELQAKLFGTVDGNKRDIEEIKADVKRILDIYVRYNGKTGR